MITIRTRTQLFSRAGQPMLADWSISPIQHPPWIDLRENSTVTFTCGCSAYPAPKIYWEIAKPWKDNQWYRKGIGKESDNVLLGEKILQVNSTLTFTVQITSFGCLIRCICWRRLKEEVQSEAIRLRFVRMLVIFFLPHSCSIILLGYLISFFSIRFASKFK